MRKYGIHNIILPSTVLEWLAFLLSIHRASGSETWPREWGTFVIFISHSRHRISSQVLQHQVTVGHSHEQFVSISLNSNIQVTDLLSVITLWIEAAVMCGKLVAYACNLKPICNTNCCCQKWDWEAEPWWGTINTNKGMNTLGCIACLKFLELRQIFSCIIDSYL
jgi:hypothetical protein